MLPRGETTQKTLHGGGWSCPWTWGATGIPPTRTTGAAALLFPPLSPTSQDCGKTLHSLTHTFTQRAMASQFTARKKIVKAAGEPDDFEQTVAQAIFDLEATNTELKGDLRELYITSAKEVDISASRKAIVVQVPFRLLKPFHKIQQRLVRELEKKFSGKDVVIVAARRIMQKPTTGISNARPRSRTLTAVHEAILEDLVYPTEIVGKRIRYKLDGSKLLKVYLDPKDRNTTEYKLETFAGVYKRLTGKDVVFEFEV